MHIRDIMTTRVATVSMDDRLSVIKDIFEQAHFRHLLVLEEGELVGVISDRDLFRAISPYLDSEAEMSRDTETLTKRAHQIMSRQPVTIAPPSHRARWRQTDAGEGGLLPAGAGEWRPGRHHQLERFSQGCAGE